MPKKNETEKSDLPGRSEIDSRGLAIKFAQLAQDRNMEDILILDLRDLSPVTDFFVIATGTSNRQICALADELKRLGKKINNKVWKTAGMNAGDWVVMDFFDVVVHLFNEDLRKHYDLELIWGEAPKVDW